MLNLNLRILVDDLRQLSCYETTTSNFVLSSFLKIHVAGVSYTYNKSYSSKLFVACFSESSISHYTLITMFSKASMISQL